MKPRKYKRHNFYIQDADGSAHEWGKADHDYSTDGTLVIDQTSYELGGNLLMSKISNKGSAFSRSIAWRSFASDGIHYSVHFPVHFSNKSVKVDSTRYYDIDSNLGYEKKFW